MADFTALVEVIKQAALDAVNASKPASVLYGKVVSADPLKIEVEQKMTLEGPQLILTRNVTDYNVEMTMMKDHKENFHLTEEDSHTHTIDAKCADSKPVTFDTISTNKHTHEYTGRKEFRIHNALLVDDEVLLIQAPGGQKFIVIDRLGKVS